MAGNIKVFISHGADTKPLAQQLTNALQAEGIDVWVDFKDLRPGQHHREELERAIGGAQWLVILLGPDNQATGWQETEWVAALASTWTDRDKKLLPVVFDKFEPPPFVRNWVCLRIDLQTDSDTWTHSVLDVLRNLPVGPKSHAEEQRRLAAERQQRFDEVERAAEMLGQAQPDHGADAR